MSLQHCNGDIEDVLTHQCRLLSHPCLLLQHVSWLLGQVDRFTDHTRICSNHNDSTLSPLSSTWNKQSYELCWREWFQSFCISFVLKSSLLYLKSVFFVRNSHFEMYWKRIGQRRRSKFSTLMMTMTIIRARKRRVGREEVCWADGLKLHQRGGSTTPLLPTAPSLSLTEDKGSRIWNVG